MGGDYLCISDKIANPIPTLFLGLNKLFKWELLLTLLGTSIFTSFCPFPFPSLIQSKFHGNVNKLGLHKIHKMQKRNLQRKMHNTWLTAYLNLKTQSAFILSHLDHFSYFTLSYHCVKLWSVPLWFASQKSSYSDTSHIVTQEMQ